MGNKYNNNNRGIAAIVAGSVISTDVYMQAPYVCTGLLPLSERYCIISSCCIFTEIDNNFNLSWNIIIIISSSSSSSSSSSNGSGCYVVVIIVVIMSV
jgi:hypothetical protein